MFVSSFVVSTNAIEKERQSIPDTSQGSERTTIKDESNDKCGKSSLQSGSNTKSRRKKKNKISSINIAPIAIPSKRSKDSVTDIIL